MVKPELSGKSQLDKFKQAARQLECDEDEETFKHALRNVVKAPRPKVNKPS